MSDRRMDRRTALQLLGTAGGATMLPGTFIENIKAPSKPEFIFCLNTATIRDQKLGMVKELEVCYRAGFGGVELWIDTLMEYLDHGGSTRELKKIIEGFGLTIEDAIGFEPWIVDDEPMRRKAIGNLKKQMNILAEIGCTRIAAPPAGATDTAPMDLNVVADRYGDIVDIGKQAGVIPQLELWGFSTNLHTLSQVSYVAIQCGRPDAKVLLDNYHLYKGGSDVASLHLLDHSATDVLHVNDYPKMNRADIQDADRVMPGDGVSPLQEVIRAMKSASRKLVLSVEIFNKEYYRQDAQTVARIAMEKTKKAVAGIS